MQKLPLVLVIDDEQLLLRAIERLLADDYRVLTHERADTALAYLDGGGTCDAIVCDVRLADMTGMAFYERLKRGRPEMAARVIFMTGSDSTPESAEFLQQHGDRVLLKPFQHRELATALDAVLLR